jgi:hypothetical protein
MRTSGVSPLVATAMLVGITVLIAAPVVAWLAGYYAPFRPRYIDLAVYAGLVNENIVRLHIQHMGGESVRFEVTEPTTSVIRGWAIHPWRGTVTEFYCWTFENPYRFRQGDWAYAEINLPGADFEVGDTVRVIIGVSKVGVIFDAEVTINVLGQIPGG